MIGNVPFYTEESPFGSDAPKQSNRAESFSFLEGELNAIENELPAPGAAEITAALTCVVVWMLQAKVYLNAKVYVGTDKNTECITACKKVIGSNLYSLQDNWRDC